MKMYRMLKLTIISISTLFLGLIPLRDDHLPRLPVIDIHPFFSDKDHPIYKIPKHITGRLILKTQIEAIKEELRRLDTLALEWDFKLAKPSFALGEVIWGTLTVHNPNETSLILSIPYVGGEYISSIELWKAVLGKQDDPKHYHANFRSSNMEVDGDLVFERIGCGDWNRKVGDPFRRPMILAPKKNYQTRLTLNVDRNPDVKAYRWKMPIVLNRPGKHRFFLRYINIEAYLPYEKRKNPPTFDEKKDGIVEKLRPPTPDELERKRKGPLMYRGIPVILGPYDVEIVEEATEHGALSKRTSTRLNKLRWEKASDEVLASLNDLSQSWPHEDPLKDSIRMSQVRVLAKLGREQEAAELVSQIASPDALALKEALQLPDPPQKEPEPVNNGNGAPEPIQAEDPPATPGRTSWIIASIAAVLAGVVFFLFLRRRRA